MIFSAVNICYDPSHQPFASEGAVKIEDLDSERPASKIIRSVLRESDIDPEDAANYSIHRCYCSFKIKIEDEDEDETFNPESTLNELEIKDGDSVFIRRINLGEEKEEEEGSTLRRSSRKRKETDYNEDDHYSSSNVTSPSTSRKRRSTSGPSNARAAVDKISSNLKNLASKAAATARSISKLLGGDGWKDQSIGDLGPIQTRGTNQLLGLARLVKTSLPIEQDSELEPGLFNSDLVEALSRAYHQRVGFTMVKTGQRNFFELGLADYEQANELLKGKIRDDGSWERSSISHLGQSALSKPEERFHLSDSGLSGQRLSTARAICVLWGNGKWINQAPSPELSPISLKAFATNAILRQIAELTRVKPGEAAPDGFPLILLEALRETIKRNKEAFNSLGGGSQAGWAQNRCLKDALALLKKSTTGSNPPSITERSPEASGSGTSGERQVRRKLDDGK